MNGALATPAARRPAAESAARSTAAPPVRAPARELATPPSAVLVAPAAVPGTRERLQASFGAAETLPAAPGGEAPPALVLVPPTEDRPTTRDRIVNRALAAPVAEPERAASVDVAAPEDLRRPRRTDVEPTPAPSKAERALAPVVDLAARRADVAPPRTDVAAAAAPARGPPTAEPEKPAQPTPTTPAAPAAVAVGVQPTPESPAGAAAPEPTTVPAAEAGATPSAEAAAPAVVAPAQSPAEAPAPDAAAPEAQAAAPSAAPAVAPTPEQPAPAVPEAAAAPAPVAAPSVFGNPEDDAGFQAMRERTGRNATRTRIHQPGRIGAETAQGASQPDQQKDVASQAADDHVETLGDKEPGPFDPEKFKADVKAKVEGMAPPATLEEADEFEESGKAAGATEAIHGIVTGGRASAEGDIKSTNETAPDAEGKVPKAATDMVNDAPGPALPDVGAGAALPKPVPQWVIDLGGGPQLVEAKMKEGNLTDEQLVEGNEPQFSAALEARDEVREHAASDPAAYRTHEELVLAQGRTEAETAAGAQLEGMHAARGGTLAGVLGVKGNTKEADRQLHDDVHQAILDIHEQTQADVKLLLDLLDTTVDSIFTSEEQAARKHFEDYVAEEMREYKADRYSGWFGWGRWLKDKAFDLPEEVNRFYERGRKDYLDAMDRAIELIASVVGALLGAAHARIQAGREQVRELVKGLPTSRQKDADEVAADLDNRFDQLASDVDAKRDELVDTVARKYVESRDDLDSRIKELQEENKGFVSRAIDAVVGVIKTIYELSKLLLRVLLKAASAIGDIVAHPIRFLGNLVDAVKGGLERFVDRLPTHLQESLVDLLFGELGRTGITMPKQLDFAGIVDLVLQVLGLTYASIRERVAKRYGEDAVAKMEEKVDVFKTLVKDGVGGMWTWIQEKLADLEDLVIGKIKEFVEERVVRAGIGYIVALLNPAAAFIKACQGIYQIVMFIVERARQIAEFVDAVLDSIAAIAQGNVGAAVEKIDNALAGALTLAIGFLARLANLGALSEKMRSIIAVVRRPIARVVDTVVFGAADVFRRTLGPAVAFAKAKVKSGKDFLKGKTKAEKERLQRGPELAEAAPPEKKVADGPEAHPTDPLPDASAAGPLVVHEPFQVEGHEHEVYTGEDGTELVLASNGPTPITRVPDPLGRLAQLHGQYTAARTRYDAAVAQLAANPHSRPGITAARARVNTIIRRIVARIRQLRPDDNPGASAPGIGDRGRHGAKRTSIRFGPPLWHLESEHVIPFAVGKQLWDASGELIPGRGGRPDRQQTTIMIYYGAARLKTSRHDEALWTAFREQYNANLRPTVRSLQTVLALAENRGRPNAFVRHQAEELLGRFKRGLLIAGASAVEATDEAVRDEHATTDGGGPTNGARRAEPSPLPRHAEIQSVAAEQFNDVFTLVSDDVEDRLGR